MRVAWTGWPAIAKAPASKLAAPVRLTVAGWPTTDIVPALASSVRVASVAAG